MAGSFGKIKSLIINYPPLQGTLILIISLILIFVLKTTFNGWLIAATAILFFAAGTTVLGLLKKKWTGYVIQSVVTFILLTVLIILFTRAITHVSLKAEPSIYYFLIILIIFYFALNFLAAIFRSIIKFLDKI
jgi:hypothetical protein